MQPWCGVDTKGLMTLYYTKLELPWRPKYNRQVNFGFLGGRTKQPRNVYFLACNMNRQENFAFPWPF